jgi:hypothetical protein
MTPNPYGIPDDFYLGTIARGYGSFNLDVRVLNEAVKHAYKNTRKLRYADKAAASPAAL